MLVLTRRLGETIVIDGNIRVTVLDVRGERVRLGIEAPANVPVYREEVHRQRSQFDPDRAAQHQALTAIPQPATVRN